MTRIRLRTLGDQLGQPGPINARLTATATSLRVDAADVTFPAIVKVSLDGTEQELDLIAPDGTWAWRFEVFPVPGGSVLKGVYTFEDVPVIDWADMTLIDPSTLEPLQPLPPNAQEILVQAGEARDDAQDARDVAVGVSTGLPAAAATAVGAQVEAQVAPLVSQTAGSASAAAGSASSAETSKTLAATSATNAETAATNAGAAAGVAATAAVQPVKDVVETGRLSDASLRSTFVAQGDIAASAPVADAPWTPGSPVHPYFPEVLKAVGFGSSTQAGMTADLTTAFSAFGVTYTNRAASGERYEHTLARCGIVNARLTFPANTIPASGAVVVTTSLPTTFALQSYVGTVSGVRGTLSLTGGVFTFTRGTTGTATASPAASEFVASLTNLSGVPVNPSYRAQVSLVDCGKNNADDANSAPLVNAATDKLFDWLVPMVKRALVIGQFANSGSTAAHKANIAAVNAARLARYGQLYVDVQSYVIGSQIWTDTGITPTSDDLAKQALGEKPPGLSLDAAHLSDRARQAVVYKLIIPRLFTLGWYTGTIPQLPPLTPPDITTGLRARWKASALTGTEGSAVSSWDVSDGTALVLNNKPATSAWPTLSLTDGPGSTKAVKFSRASLSAITSQAISPTIAQPFTYLAVVKSDTGGTLVGGSTSAVRVLGRNGTWTTFTSTGDNVLTNPVGPDNTWQVVALSVSGASSSYVVGNTSADGSLPTSATIGRFMVGGVVTTPTGDEASFLNGSIVEVALWTRALKGQDLTAAINDAKARYGLS